MQTTKFSAVFLGCLLILDSILPAAVQDKAHLSIDASKAGAKIDRNIFGQFAENLGRGHYGGIWVGLNSPIPNTRGIRNDVVVTPPRLDAIGAKDASGKLWLEVTNLDPEKPLRIDADITGIKATTASGETLTAPAVDSVNTFDSPDTVVPRPAAVKFQNGKLSLSLAPKSVTVVSIGR